MKNIRSAALVLLTALILSACSAYNVRLESLAKPANPADLVTVKGFKYYDNGFALESGVYVIEYENEDGRFYRGPDLAVQIPAAANFNKERFPDSKFPGGLFVPKSNDIKAYRAYFYMFNLGGSLDPHLGEHARSIASNIAPPTSTASGIGTGVGEGIVAAMVHRDVGQIRVLPPIEDVDIRLHVSRP
ncbi:hypothetical protein [Uliginosibacterium sp. H1]|uniref:hypothetical protein n=1 Tax=Uliginosibacterium sp. H1 TaxID=3114757 RepID=UPI002E18B44F|nr:hypothetical protein [Uliginosibacterium sp. H1]